MTVEGHGENLVKVVMWQKNGGVRISCARKYYQYLISVDYDRKMKSEL